MSNSYKFYSDTKDIMKKYVNATEGAIIYGISKSRIMVLASIHTITNGMRKECLWITFFIRLIHIIFTVLVLFYFRHFAQAT